MGENGIHHEDIVFSGDLKQKDKSDNYYGKIKIRHFNFFDVI